MRKPRLNRAVATVAVETVFSLLRVASLSLVILLCPFAPSFRDGPKDQTSGAQLRTGECRDSGFDASHRPGMTRQWLDRSMRFHVERVDRVATRHVEAIVLRTAEGEIGATLRQANMSQRLAGGTEHHHTVEVFRLALELEHLSAADI